MAFRRRQFGGCIVSVQLAVVLVVSLCMSEMEAAAVGAAGSAPAWDHAGADHWYENYPDCGGYSQSPIEVTTYQALYDPSLQNLDFSDYSITSGVNMKLANVGGHTAQLTVAGRDITLKGASLPAPYVLEQFHFHWGADNTRGSEHSFNGTFYSAEIHFVHRRQDYANVSMAAPKPNGLAVVAFMIKVGRRNSYFERIMGYIPEILNADDEVEISTFSLKTLIPAGTLHYYRYQGSLTTPPCYESVNWIVVQQVIEMSSEQLNRFREMNDHNNQPLVDDYRPIQNLNRRTVITNKRP